MYRIEYARQAAKAMQAMPREMAATVRGKIERLAADPFAPNPNVKKLVGRDGYRLRIGSWRVIYEIHGDRLVIFVLAVAPRGSIYQ